MRAEQALPILTVLCSMPGLTPLFPAHTLLLLHDPVTGERLAPIAVPTGVLADSVNGL